MSRPFITPAHRFERTIQAGQETRVVPAEITHPDGVQTSPGVAIFNGYQLLTAITAEHAYSLADAIADTLETLTKEPTA